ncbi:hypothetical protein [Deinococcus sp. 23YEL01]|uniref:hypothetical protein n=1 Tax=Deinococcus sp. 23YEL01 TaxID=2745871 RepID=UPI001E31FD04|nr:hypothetical protein [Deinococcus sp. 23YEL01]MCD0168013.1 hypothetical protein [Deinococcus sp. 23YEL01]
MPNRPSRHLHALALTAALAITCTAPAATDPPPTPDPAPPTSTATVNITERMTWWQVLGVVVMAVGVPGATAYFGYSASTRRQQDNATAQRDAADLNAINARDKSYAELLALFTTQLQQNTTLAAEAAANKARLEGVETRQKEREERERDLIAKVAALEVKHVALNEHVNACAGGHPCPLASRARNTA